MLAQAAGVVASPQIRNVGTLGGNLNQDARCWYYRRGLDCYRAGATSAMQTPRKAESRARHLWREPLCGGKPF